MTGTALAERTARKAVPMAGHDVKHGHGLQPTERDVKWLIRLADPDVHPDAATTLKATRTTAWLNDLLDTIRRTPPP